MSRLTIIVAATKANGIGVNAGLPWKLSKELKYFAQATTTAPEGRQNVVIMGRNTWESIPTKFRPLPRRMNVVVSRNTSYDLCTSTSSVHLTHDLKSALGILTPSKAEAESIHRGFVIGGARLYTEALKLPVSSTEPYVDRILLTRILTPEFVECDVFIPDFLTEGLTDEAEIWKRATHKDLQEWVGFNVPEGELEEKGVKYEFQMWVRGT
ncbi:dihydrofolate reductase [Pholiota conissans]|uniref:Dihydrofolate reductase n=1 Tax=Pholiota conissans TaxID=109636 RepID=A0A9P6CTL7_9AGAR|nr:dihydrofolate reductase [Pholiota conissans]